MKFNIIGGGIGGLSTALVLHELGHEVQVFESVKKIKPLGVGINTLPHCVRIFTNLGLQEKIASMAIETSNLIYFNKFGQEFWTEPRGRAAGYKWPQFSVHRGALQLLLTDEVIKRLGSGAIRTNHHFDHFEQTDDKVICTFIDKETKEKVGSYTSDIMIGADGIGSRVRQQLYPNEGSPVYSDNVLYRGTTRMQPYLDGKSMAMIGTMKQKMVVYPIEAIAKDGTQLINWVANLREGESALKDRDWNRKADQKRLIHLYKGWNFDWLNVANMVTEADAVYEFPMSDRNPLDQWTFGRVTLLGDAAHPMYPIGSNGASQAVIDADYLGICLQQHDNPLEALMAYDKERVPAAAKIVLQNRAKGPDQVMDMMQEWFPNGFNQDEIPHDRLAEVMDNYKVIAGFDIESLNSKS